MSSSNPSGSGGVPKPPKSKRKISLPWFRGSVTSQHPALTRQHTIDTPSSFQARLLRSQPSQNALAGVVEMTWVVSDYAASNAQELSVIKGQQVEVLEVCPTKPDFCLVRMPTRGTDTSAVPEGLVPLSVLKQPPAPRSSPSRRPPPQSHASIQHSADHDDPPSGSNDCAAINTSSPVNKRRGFSGRKWLPPPLRKLSQGKVEKTQSTPDRPPLKKTGSDKRIKVPTDMGNKPSVSEGEDEEDRVQRGVRLATTELANGGGEDADDEVELPPPMKPIQESILVTGGGGGPPSATPPNAVEENPCKRVSSLTLKSLEGATSADLAEIEQIVKERMEQHTENQERNSVFRESGKYEGLATLGGSSDIESTLSLAAAQCSSNNESSMKHSWDESGSKSEDLADNKELYLQKRNYVLKELVDTEENYVDDLKLIVEGYLRVMNDETCEIPKPDDLKSGKDKMVFGNIENIYDWHKDHFLDELRKCSNNPGGLGPLFKRYERKLHMYVVYCKNKPVSEFIVTEYLDNYFEELRILLGHKLQICDLLIKPVQRIMKYQLLLKDILKYTERAGIDDEAKMLKEALYVMTVVPKAANDMMDVGRLQGFEGKITAQGKLLLNGTLVVTDQSPNNVSSIGKKKELHVFLFEQSIIFSESSGAKNQFTSPTYNYKTHLQVNNLSLKVVGDAFVLKTTDPSKASMQLHCVAQSVELLDQWHSTIDAILQSQHNFLKAIQSPIAYQKELTKDA